MTDHGPTPDGRSDDVAALRDAVGWSMHRPPPVVTQQLLTLFDEAHGMAPPRQRTVAHRADDREPLLVRSASIDPNAHSVVFTSELADVVVEIGDGVVTGQVIPIVRPTPAAFAVTVLDGPTGARSFDGGEDGTFSLPRLDPGWYRLLLDNTHLEIELEVEVR